MGVAGADGTKKAESLVVVKDSVPNLKSFSLLNLSLALTSISYDLGIIEKYSILGIYNQ